MRRRVVFIEGREDYDFIAGVSDAHDVIHRNDSDIDILQAAVQLCGFQFDKLELFGIGLDILDGNLEIVFRRGKVLEKWFVLIAVQVDIAVGECLVGRNIIGKLDDRDF